MNPIDELHTSHFRRGSAAGTRIYPKVRQERPQVVGEILDTTWSNVRPFDHVDEGRVVTVMAWAGPDPDIIRVTIASPTVTHGDRGRWNIEWRDPEVDEHHLNDSIRVMRGIPLGPPK